MKQHGEHWSTGELLFNSHGTESLKKHGQANWFLNPSEQPKLMFQDRQGLSDYFVQREENKDRYLKKDFGAEVVNYIKRCRRKGLKDEEIKAELIRNGWESRAMFNLFPSHSSDKMGEIQFGKFDRIPEEVPAVMNWSRKYAERNPKINSL